LPHIVKFLLKYGIVIARNRAFQRGRLAVIVPEQLIIYRGQHMENTGPSPIVGVFREQTKADHAVEELKQAGFTDEQITSKVVGLPTTSGEQTPENTRTLLIVKAEGKDKQAFGILFNNGANNADLPAGMTLSGTILTSEGETVDLIPQPELEGSFSNDSFFATEKNLETTDQLGQMDKL
jgi:hypothetical protein